MDLRKVQGGQRDLATPGFLGSPVPRDWLGKTFCQALAVPRPGRPKALSILAGNVH